MTSFSISAWNIQGLNSYLFGLKSRNLDFLDKVTGVDIIILQETWCKGEVPTGCPPNYREIIVPSTKLNGVTQGRDSGGMLVWYKSQLADSIEIKKKGKYHIWLKLEKGIISSEKSIFLCAIYIPPIESPYFDEEIFSTIEEETSHFQAQGSVLIMGDLNSRTGEEADITSTEGDSYITGDHLNFPILTNRNNYDKNTNKSGKQVLQLCRELGLYITNGRLRGDSFGRYTYCSRLGSSTVDYAITDLDLTSLRAFTVKEQTPLSDHSQITLYLKRADTGNICSQPCNLYNIKMKYRWAQNSLEQYQDAMVSESTQSLLDSFLAQIYPQNNEGVECCLIHINHIFDHLALSSNLKCKTEQPKKTNRERWFDSDCKSIRKILRNISNQKHRNPDSLELRLSYCETLKQYKNTLRTKKDQYIQNQLQLIEESLGSNKFWEKWNLFTKKHKNEQSIQNGDTWKNHFGNLYRKPTKNQAQEHISAKLKNLESAIKDYQNPLDYPITGLELEDKLKALQNKKACGTDGILNEMLKHTNRKCKLAILKIFNLVLSVGYFPESWSEGLITPIFKNGDKYDPNNYRGICVSSNLGKLFGSILNSRIIDFLSEHNVLSRSQIGFLPNYRTADHIFTLHTLIDKYVNQNKGKIQACFVDFQKAFDSVWHEGLLFKLIESGIGGKSFDVIKSIYENNKLAVKIGDKHTDFFPQGRGVKQGCNLSPTLFNIYINELALLLEQSTAPGLTLTDTEIKCLFYADDLVILSPTREGLQQSLDILHQYCQTWALTVNMKKTKIMTFQKRSRLQRNDPEFKIGGTQIEQTNSYTYLGLQISSTGNFCSAVKELKEKAKRAFYAIKRSVKIQIPIRTWLKIFKSVIESIALYGSEVWGPLLLTDWAKWDKNPIEILHVEFCKTILRVQRKSPNSACRAELGQYPLLINMQKRSIKFWSHLKKSDPACYHHKALACQELDLQRSPFCQLVMKLADISHSDITNPSQPQKIRPNQIITKEKDKYITYWNQLTQSQHKLETYLALNRQYTVADYLSTVTDKNLRKTLTMYRLSDHDLAIEKGRHRQTWLPREERLCCLCDEGAVETELHFLTQCENYRNIREEFFPKIEIIFPEFQSMTEVQKLSFLLGEQKECAVLAAKYVNSCHKKRDNQ